MTTLKSPVRVCNGFCPLPGTKRRKMAKVVCISSCKDYQRTWEVPGGLSLTQTLIKKCSNDPYPLLADLMFHVKCENFKNFGKVFEKVQKYFEEFQSWQEVCKKRKRTIPRRDSMWLPTKLRQDPQLSSPEPLDMEAIRWNP